MDFLSPAAQVRTGYYIAFFQRGVLKPSRWHWQKLPPDATTVPGNVNRGGSVRGLLRSWKGRKKRWRKGKQGKGRRVCSSLSRRWNQTIQVSFL